MGFRLGFGLLTLVAAASVFLWIYPGVFARFVSTPLAYTPVQIADVEMACFDETTPTDWSYCVNRLPGSQKGAIVYHFHGRRGNATWWNDDTYYSGDVVRAWKRLELAPPTVVSISFGPLWLLRRDGLLETLVDVVIPRIEARLDEPVESRMVVGESMGGVNALLIWLNTEMAVSGVAALCPPLPTVAPTAPASEIAEYVRGGPTSWYRAVVLLAIGRHLFPTPESWLENNPLERIAQVPDLADRGRLYLTCGKRDDWGCMAGSERLVAAAEHRGARVEWHPRAGGHCDIEPVSLAKFLARSSPGPGH